MSIERVGVGVLMVSMLLVVDWGVNAMTAFVAIAGGVVDVGKMIGSSWTANGSRGGGVWDGGIISAPFAVGVCGTPQMDGDAAHADKLSDRTMMIAKMRYMVI